MLAGAMLRRPMDLLLFYSGCRMACREPRLPSELPLGLIAGAAGSERMEAGSRFCVVNGGNSLLQRRAASGLVRMPHSCASQCRLVKVSPSQGAGGGAQAAQFHRWRVARAACGVAAT